LFSLFFARVIPLQQASDGCESRRGQKNDNSLLKYQFIY
jgi:hypothetical protein